MGHAKPRLDFRRSLVSGLRSSPKREFGGRSAGSFPKQRLVIEPMQNLQVTSHEEYFPKFMF